MGVAMMEARALGPGKNVVVLLADSIRNYTGKFVKTEWMQQYGFLDDAEQQEQKKAEDKWRGQTIKDMSLPEAVTADSKATVSSVVQTLKERGFDSLPIVNEKK